MKWKRRSPVNSHHKGQWRGSLMFSLIRSWANGWANHRAADDLKLHCTHYDGSVMIFMYSLLCPSLSKYVDYRSILGSRQNTVSYNMMTSSNGNIFRVTGPFCGEFNGPGEFPTQRPVTWNFDVFFDLLLNKRLSKQPWGWWFETLSWSLWRHCNDNAMFSRVTSVTVLY